VSALDFDVTDPSQTLVEETEKYVSIPEWVLLHPELSAPAVRLYGVLKMYARRTERAWPGRKTLAAHLGCSEDTIDRHVKQLQAVGAVDVIPRWMGPSGQVLLGPIRGAVQTSSIYRLRWTAPVQGGGRTDAGTPRRTDAGTVAAQMRPEAHAVETHAPEAQLRARANAIGPRHQALALADEMISEGKGAIVVPRGSLAELLLPALAAGTDPDALHQAVRDIVHDGKKLAPWTLQEYVAKGKRAATPWFVQ
jgi:hypothetical protein